MSSLSWLDYSDDHRRRMLGVVDFFSERNTRDELGLGSVRDAFADAFFPGISTIMTRARYFLLIPWIYQRLEDKKISSAEITRRARQAELDLVQVIESSDDNQGNIGSVAQSTLKRLPSSVYWNGLGVWGIRTFPGTQSHYHRAFDRHAGARQHHDSRGAGRDSEADEILAQNWHGGLISPPEDFHKKASLRLSRREAEYLCDRIRFAPTCGQSLLAAFVARRTQLKPTDFVWEQTAIKSFPTEMRSDLEHAQNFSEIMHGAVLLYNLMLAEQTKREELRTELTKEMTQWSAMIAARQSAFSSWNRSAFWRVVDRHNPRVRPATRVFIDAWCDIATAPDRRTLLTAPRARDLIRQREQQLKKNLARIDNPQTSHQWEGESGMGRLDLRWTISQRLLEDLFDGLEGPDA